MKTSEIESSSFWQPNYFSLWFDFEIWLINPIKRTTDNQKIVERKRRLFLADSGRLMKRGLNKGRMIGTEKMLSLYLLFGFFQTLGMPFLLPSSTLVVSIIFLVIVLLISLTPSLFYLFTSVSPLLWGLQHWLRQTIGLTQGLSGQNQTKSNISLTGATAVILPFYSCFSLAFPPPFYLKSLPSCMPLIRALFLKLCPPADLLSY